ncbi:MAG: flagellar protein FlgN [Nitrospinota bacterium]
MRKEVEGILKSLKEEIALHRELVTLLEGDRSLMMELATKELEESNGRKAFLASSIRQAEAERMKLVEKLAETQGLDAGGLKLRDIMAHSPEALAGELEAARQSLLELTSRAAELKERNLKLIRRSLELFEGAMSAIRRGLEEPGRYGRQGLCEGAELNGRFLSRAI